MSEANQPTNECTDRKRAWKKAGKVYTNALMDEPSTNRWKIQIDLFLRWMIGENPCVQEISYHSICSSSSISPLYSTRCINNRNNCARHLWALCFNCCERLGDSSCNLRKINRMVVRNCLHGDGRTLLEGAPSYRKVTLCLLYFLFGLHER